MIEVEFTKDFANKKAGDRFICDSQLACHLIGVDKVAKQVTETKEDKKAPARKTKELK